MRQLSDWRLFLGIEIEAVQVDKQLDLAGPYRCMGPSVSPDKSAGSCFEGGAQAHAGEGHTCPLRPG